MKNVLKMLDEEKAVNANKMLAAWLDQNSVVDKDKTNDNENMLSPAEKRRRLLAKKCDARLDLHGKTQAESQEALKTFFASCHEQGMEKILIVHGKGNHSKEGNILKTLCRNFIEQCSYAGENGPADADEGGNGATWVILRNKNV
ncbi:DNA mismatch repair protein MutS [Spirochaetia bacterium]|nr:DNA mismatch repair protein MutS [Spirochaetia bacterium]